MILIAETLPAETLPALLKTLTGADKILTATLFATVAGLALTASAFAFTAANALDEAAAKYMLASTDDDDNARRARHLKKERKSVLAGGIKMVWGFFFLVIGLVFVLGLDSWGNQVLDSAVEAKNYGKAYGLEWGEMGSAGSMLILGFGALMAGANKLRSAMQSLHDY